MKIMAQAAMAALAFAAALLVAAQLLPKLLPAALAIFGMVIVGRLVFYLTRRDRW
jgi:hypothetical protein